LIKPDYEMSDPFDADSYVEQIRIRIQNAVKEAMDNKALSSKLQKNILRSTS